jgi:hypothetical protein
MVQCVDDIATGLELVGHRHGVLQIEKYQIGAGFGRLLQHAWITAWYGQFASVKAVPLGHVDTSLLFSLLSVSLQWLSALPGQEFPQNVPYLPQVSVC